MERPARAPVPQSDTAFQPTFRGTQVTHPAPPGDTTLDVAKRIRPRVQRSVQASTRRFAQPPPLHGPGGG